MQLRTTLIALAVASGTLVGASPAPAAGSNDQLEVVLDTDSSINWDMIATITTGLEYWTLDDDTDPFWPNVSTVDIKPMAPITLHATPYDPTGPTDPTAFEMTCDLGTVTRLSDWKWEITDWSAPEETVKVTCTITRKAPATTTTSAATTTTTSAATTTTTSVVVTTAAASTTLYNSFPDGPPAASRTTSVAPSAPSAPVAPVAQGTPAFTG